MSRYEEIKSKQVHDSDGFLTDYTWYKDTETGNNVFVFGDKDFYGPEDEYFDWEEENDQVAEEWFDNYGGFQDDDSEEDDDLMLDIDESLDEAYEDDTISVDDLRKMISDKIGSVNECVVEEKKPHRIGTPEYDANEGRKKRVSDYRKYANIDEDFDINEDNIDDWALTKTCVMNGKEKDRVKSEILGIKWSEYEE